MKDDCGEMFKHNGVTYYVGWMRERVPGDGKFGMWLNEQPNGGFRWEFIDYKPDDEQNYEKIFISAIDPRNDEKED